MLHLIGLGLNDVNDISLRALETIKNCEFIYLENYTAIFNSSIQEMEELFGKKVILADRDLVEKGTEIIDNAKKNDVAFLVVGDPMSATTHSDLILRAVKEKVAYNIIHNISILTAVGSTGLQLYKFGKTPSIVFPDGDWLPSTPYNVLKFNKSNNLHTLLLLDIKVKEPSKEDIRKNIDKYKEPKYMTIKEAIEILLKLSDDPKVFSKNTMCVGVARLGSEDQVIKYGTAGQLMSEDFGAPLHSLIVPGSLHFMEEEFLEMFKK